MGTKNKINKRPYLDPEMQRRLQGIPLPPKLKCDRCDKWKGTIEGFSQTQRDKAKYELMRNGMTARYTVTCTRCVGPLTEIECSVCGEVKGITSFARSQRTKPDQAKCYKCVERRLELDAINEDVYEQDLTKAQVPLDSSAGRMPDYFDSTTQSAQSAVPVSESGYDSDEDGGVSLNGAIAGINRNPSVPTNTLIDTTDNTTASTGTNGWSVATGPRKAPSQYSMKTSSTFGSNIRNKSNQDFKVGSSGFAKIKAYKPEKVPPPEEDDDWKSESEDEDDAEYSSGDDDTMI